MKDRPPVHAHRAFAARQAEFVGKSMREVFEEISRSNLWGGEESRSGLGSSSDATSSIQTYIEQLIPRLGLRSILDAPCGDFTWMQHVTCDAVEYIGADIVEDIIADNRARYGHAPGKRQFLVRDITVDALPQADLVLCRDCLVHVPFADITRALRNYQQSGARYLLTTTFTAHDRNIDCACGDWRMLNFERPPFNFPAPLDICWEGCEEAGGHYRDKALALWRVADLPL